MIDLFHPQTNLFHFFLFPNWKHSLLIGMAKGKATPETAELFWGHEADSDTQSRSSIVILMLKLILTYKQEDTWFPPAPDPQWDPLLPAAPQTVPMAAASSSLGPFRVLGCPATPHPGARSWASTCQGDVNWHWLKISPLGLTANFIALLSGWDFPKLLFGTYMQQNRRNCIDGFIPLHDVT